MEFPADIVRLAGDPRTGIVTAFPMGLPNIGQVQQWLADKLAHRDRLQKLDALPRFERMALPRPEPSAGDLANVLVRRDHQLYPKMIERAKTGSPREYEHVSEGIRVALGWLEGPQQHIATKHFKTPSAEDLDRLYGKRPAEDGEAA